MSYRAPAVADKPWAQGATRRLEELRPHPDNPHGQVDPSDVEDLADSIRAQGVLQPLLITPEGVIVAGHRRHAAALRAGLAEVPVIVKTLSEQQQLEIMLVENVQREDLTPVQEARAYRALIDVHGYRIADVARVVGVNTARVTSRLQLLTLDDQVQQRFHRGELPMTLAPVLAKITEPAHQRRIAAMAARRQYSVPDLEKIVDRALGILTSPAPARPRGPDGVPESIDPGLSHTRKNALEWLAQDSGRAILFADLAAVFELTCCACGMESSEEVCSACPLAEFMVRLAKLPKPSGVRAA